MLTITVATLLHIAKGHRVATASSNTKRRTVLAISKGSRMPHNISQRASACINVHQRALREASAAMFGYVRLVRESRSACETCETLRPQLGASSCIFTCGRGYLPIAHGSHGIRIDDQCCNGGTTLFASMCWHDGGYMVDVLA